MDTTKIKAVIQEPGEISVITDFCEIPRELVSDFDRTFTTGELEKHGLYLLYDNRVLLPRNIVAGEREMCGTVVIVAMENGVPEDMSVSQIQQARSWLLRHRV
ncbi:MAG: hypothetical protein IJU51_04565 [Clostridia bacterium]|nr:hypothetical protein [Clostridia bacterium]